MKITIKILFIDNSVVIRTEEDAPIERTNELQDYFCAQLPIDIEGVARLIKGIQISSCFHDGIGGGGDESVEVKVVLAPLLPSSSSEVSRAAFPKVKGVGRDYENDRNICVYFERSLTDEELRAFHDLLSMLDQLQGNVGPKH